MSPFTQDRWRFPRTTAALGVIAVVALGLAATVSAQNDNLKQLLQGVDLAGVEQLRLSPDGELATGLTGLQKNPDARSGSFSQIKIWSIKAQELMHKFRVPGKAYAVVFSPDGSTVATADRTGNLGYITTIRAWDLVEGTEREIGTCTGEIGDFYFSPDGRTLAAVAKQGWLDHPSAVAQINLWPVAGAGRSVSIDTPHPLGEWLELRPPMEAWKGERMDEVFRRVAPVRVRFSSDGKRLICETETGLRTIYDSRTGSMLKHANLSSVGAFKSMLMLALHQAPEDAKSLTIEIMPNEKTIAFQRTAEGWWQADKAGKATFKVDGERFVSLIKGVEKTEQIAMRLGLQDGTKLAELSSFDHPLGVIKLNRDKMALNFRLEYVKAGTESRETLQTVEMRYQY